MHFKIGISKRRMDNPSNEDVHNFQSICLKGIHFLKLSVQLIDLKASMHDPDPESSYHHHCLPSKQG